MVMSLKGWKGPWRQVAALLGVVSAALIGVSNGLPAYDTVREQSFDIMLGRLAQRVQAPTRVVVVDINRASLEKVGPWPWSREQIASLIAAVNAAKPLATGLDILIEGPDERSPAALARRLAELTNSAAVRDLAAGLADGDARLAIALRMSPTVAGLVLEPEKPGELPPPVPVLAQGGSDLSAMWQADGVSGPPMHVGTAAAGLGVLSLAGDADGRVRRVPLLTLADEEPRPGLAVEILRVANKHASYVLADGNRLRVGPRTFPIGPDASLRLVPLARLAAVERIPAHTIGEPQHRDTMQGSIVLIGGSAPQLGGLRPGSGGALVASVDLQATAVRQLLAGVHPYRPVGVERREVAALAATGIAAGAAGLLLSPLAALISAVALAVAWLAGSGVLLSWSQVLIDPLAVPLLALAGTGLAVLVVAADTRRREAQLRRRFEQHLAPELVSRLVEKPELLKLAGETREVTILFTDVEGFTSMTERSDPATLIRVLDRYIDEMSAIIVAHGGMVEKIVGDGFHGLFNAPLDLADHADKAVACAEAIQAFSVRFMTEDEPKSLGFGRTRVGIETGPVIVGDVGGGTRLDYTAYGNAMNTAARLEALNKELGSAICIGPATAAALSDRSRLRPLGRLSVRGRSEAMELCDLWPADMSEDQRKRFAHAMAQAERNPAAALAAIASIARERPRDTAIAGVALRLSDAAGARALRN